MGIQLGGTQSTQASTLGGGLNLGRPTGTPTPAPSTGGIQLTKGAKVDLTKGNPGLDRIIVGLGWDVNESGGQTYDLDAEAFLLGANGKVVSPAHVIFYNNTLSTDGSVKHNGDNLTGDGEGDDETVSIQLSKVSADVQKIVFTVTIHDAVAKRQNFGQVNNAYIRIINETNGQELLRFDLTEDYSTAVTVKVGEVYRHNNEWKFGATGSGSVNELGALCAEYGV